MGDVTTNNSAFTISTAKSITAGNISQTGNTISFTATDSITTNAITTNGKLTLDGGKAVKVKDTLKVNASNTTVKGTSSVYVSSAEVAGNATLNINAVTGYADSAVTTGNLTNNKNLYVYGKSVSTKNITNSGSAVFDIKKSFSAADVTISAGTVKVSTPETIKFGTVTMNGGATLNLAATKTLTVGSIVSPETPASTDAATVKITGTDLSTTIGSIDVKNNFNVNITSAKTKVGDITMKDNSDLNEFNIIGANIQLGDANFGKAGTYLKGDESITTGDITTEGVMLIQSDKAYSYKFGDITTAASMKIDAGKGGTLTAGTIKIAKGELVLTGKTIKLAGINANVSAADNNAVTVTAETTLDLGQVTLTNAQYVDFTSNNGNIIFDELTESMTNGVNFYAQSKTGSISGGNINSNGNLLMSATKNVTLKDVKLTAGQSVFYSTSGTVKFNSLTVEGEDTVVTLGAVPPTTQNGVYVSKLTNAGIVNVLAGSATLNGLTNSGTLNVTATSFSSTDMTENGTSNITVDSFKVTNYFSDAGKTTNVNDTNSFTIAGTCHAQGTVSVNERTGYAEPSKISIKAGAQFARLYLGTLQPIEGVKAARNLTVKNYNDLTAWVTGAYTPAD